VFLQKVLRSSGRYSNAVVQIAMSHQLSVSDILSGAGFREFVDRSTEEPRLPELSSVPVPTAPLFDAKLVTLQSQVTLLTARAEGAEETAAKVSRELETLQAELRSLKTETESRVSGSVAQANEVIHGLESKLAAAEATIKLNKANADKVAAIQADAESTKRQLMSLRIDHDDVNNRLRSTEAQLATANVTLQIATSEKSLLEGRLSAAENRCKRYVACVQLLQLISCSQRWSYSATIVEIPPRLSEVDRELGEAKETISALTAQLETAHAAVSSTKQYASHLDYAASQMDELQRTCVARLQARLENEARTWDVVLLWCLFVCNCRIRADTHVGRYHYKAEGATVPA
jgi:chromosome segregation ATPase